MPGSAIFKISSGERRAARDLYVVCGTPANKMVGLELRISERRTHDDSTPFALQSPFCVFFRLSSRATPESLKKGANIGRQCFRLFHGSEVSPRCCIQSRFERGI